MSAIQIDELYSKCVNICEDNGWVDWALDLAIMGVIKLQSIPNHTCLVMRNAYVTVNC